jgi:hypothetical protein
VALRLFLAVWFSVVTTAAVTDASATKPKPAFHVLAHVAPGGGYSADVVGERTYAYLSSRMGKSDCPAQGVRVYDLAHPRRPRHVSTFARIPGTWTEKTIVRRVRTAGFDGVLAATSVQACAGTGFGGFVVYDVTRPQHPRELARVRTEPRGSHEIWLAAARGQRLGLHSRGRGRVRGRARVVRLPHLRRHAPGRAEGGRRLERLPRPRRLHTPDSAGRR